MSESAVTIRFGADVSGLDSAVAVAKAQLAGFNAEIRKLAKEAAATGGTVSDDLAKALREASAGAAGMQRELKSLTAKPIIEVESAAKHFNKQLDNIAAFAWNNTSLSGNEIERVVNPLKGLAATIGVVPTVATAAAAAIGFLAYKTGSFAHDQLTELADAAKQSGISSTAVQGAKIVGAGAGVDSDAMVAALKAANEEFQKFKRNDGDLKDALDKIDKGFLKVLDGAKTTGEFIDLVGQKIRALPKEEGIDLAKALFDDATGEKLFEPIINGQLEMKKLGDTARAAGTAIDEGVVKGARDAQHEIDAASEKASQHLLVALEGLAAPVAALKLEFFKTSEAIIRASLNASAFVSQLNQALDQSRQISREINEHSTTGVPFKQAFARELSEGKSPTGNATLPDLDIGLNAGSSRARYEARDKDDDKKKKGAKDKSNGDALAAARAEIDGEIQAVLQQTEINKAQYELDFANKKITEDEKDRLVKQANDQQFEATKSLYEREAAIAGQKPQQRQQINNKIEALESQHQVKMLELATKEIQDAAKLAHEGAQQFAGTLTSSLSQALIGAVEHTKTKDAGRKIAQSLFSDLVNEFTKNTLTNPLEKALEPGFKAMGDLITQPFQDAIKNALGAVGGGLSGVLGATAGAAGGGAGAAALSTSALGLSSSAAELTAAAAALSSAATAIGAGGATAGGAAAAGGGLLSGIAGLFKGIGLALPAFDVGTNYVPRDMPAFIHQGERIVPAADNQALMSALNGGGNRGGAPAPTVHSSTNVNISAMDARSVSRAFHQNDRELLKAIGRAAQRGAHLGIKGL